MMYFQIVILQSAFPALEHPRTHLLLVLTDGKMVVVYQGEDK